MSPAVTLVITVATTAALAAYCVRAVHKTGLPWGVMSLALLGTANALGWTIALLHLRPGMMTASLVLSANVIAITAAAFMHRYKDAATERALRAAKVRHYTSESRIRREERRRGL